MNGAIQSCTEIYRGVIIEIQRYTEVCAHLPLDGLLHGSEVDRNVRGIGHQTPVRSKQCTREIQPLLLRW